MCIRNNCQTDWKNKAHQKGRPKHLIKWKEHVQGTFLRLKLALMTILPRNNSFLPDILVQTQSQKYLHQTFQNKEDPSHPKWLLQSEKQINQRYVMQKASSRSL
jgi:hypothetical protein